MSITPKSYLGCTIFTTQEENGVKCFLAGLSELRPKCGSTCYILLIETHFYGCGMDLLMNYGHKMSSELRSRLLLMFTDEAQNRWFLRCGGLPDLRLGAPWSAEYYLARSNPHQSNPFLRTRWWPMHATCRSSICNINPIRFFANDDPCM